MLDPLGILIDRFEYHIFFRLFIFIFIIYFYYLFLSSEFTRRIYIQYFSETKIFTKFQVSDDELSRLRLILIFYRV